MFICNHTLACASGKFSFLRFQTHSLLLLPFWVPDFPNVLACICPCSFLCIQAGKHLQQTLRGTWHCRWRTDPQHAARMSSCWQAWQKRERTFRGGKKCANNVTICSFLQAYLSSNVCWSLQWYLSKYSQYCRLTWAISCSSAAWTQTDTMYLHTYMNL